MNVLKFTLSGRTAFFKKPDVNSYYYFTYGNIHKVALLGILGAIMGFEGYNQQNMRASYTELYKETDCGKEKRIAYPEFYEKLKDIKIAIAPQNPKGYIEKKVQVFNNSVGYASKELGGNLIVKEQWLEKPVWDVYVLLSGELEKILEQRMSSLSFKFLPYLGKNDHIANIDNIVVLKDVEKLENADRIHSLYMIECFTLDASNDDLFDSKEEYESVWKYEELLPVTLEKNTNRYELKRFVYTNSTLRYINECLVYDCMGKSIFFF